MEESKVTVEGESANSLVSTNSLVVMQVTNTPGFKLPATGGAGTIAFTVEEEAGTEVKKTQSKWMEEYTKSIIISSSVLAVMLIVLLIWRRFAGRRRRKRRKKKQARNNQKRRKKKKKTGTGKGGVNVKKKKRTREEPG